MTCIIEVEKLTKKKNVDIQDLRYILLKQWNDEDKLVHEYI